MNAICDFPSISTNPINIFPIRKRKRPTRYPDSLLSKTFVINEDKFDFGPLLIGKNFEKKHEADIMKVNSSVYRITNSGKYKSEVSFDLASNVFETEDYKKGIYMFEPENIDLEVDETKEIRVWCIPDEPKKFVDELVCMIKGNPKPYVVKMVCQGSKPNIRLSVEQLEFERILLNKETTKIIKVINEGVLPAKWSLKGLEELPEEFKLSMTEGTLKPAKEHKIHITFSSEKQDKFENELKLHVEDVEEIGIIQEEQPLVLRAEAFNISVDFEGFENNEQVIQFGDVEVGRRI